MTMRPLASTTLAIAAAAFLAACGTGDGGTTDPGTTPDAVQDPGTPDEGPADPGTPDEGPGDPGVPDVPEDQGPIPDLPPVDGWSLPCDTQEGEVVCSPDAYIKYTCTGGAWVAYECMAREGRLCEDGECVDPWRYKTAPFGTCPDDPLATPETLAAKAAHYDDIAPRLHVHPDLKWAMNVTLKKVEVACEGEQVPPCYAPIASEAEATWQDVDRWHTGENDGLWSGLYLASQAFRYGATKSPEALANIKLLLEGEVTRMRITGVPGLFTRQFIPPNVPGIACPDPETQKDHYTTDKEKDDNRWVQVREDGCVWVVDRVSGEWTKTPTGVAEPHCGLDDYAGWCWLDNVSQDEYAGHMLALGILWKLVDDEDVRATVKDLMTQVGVHLMQNDLFFVDWDGRQTEHGKLHALSFADTPGFLAALSMDYILQAAVASERQDLWDYYHLCLLQQGGGQCEGWPHTLEDPYDTYLPIMELYVGTEDCKSNWNNFSMVLCAMHNLAWYETTPALREHIQWVLDQKFINEPGRTRTMILQGNPWFNFTFAAMKRLGPGSDGPAYGPVEEGICALKQFPASKVIRAADSAATYDHYCETRLGGSATEFPVPVAERCISTFEWWSDPYARETCAADPYRINQPADYLLPYWMGRYFGFIPEAL
jgi:hypothetical protein